MKKHLQNLARMRSGEYRDTTSGIFLDRNERVIPFDEVTLEKIAYRLSQIQFNLYPDVLPFYKKLSKWIGLKEEKIYVTEGVSGSIKSLIETLTLTGDNVVFPTPTFALYPVYCQMFNLEYRMVGYSNNYTLDIEALLRSIDDRTSLVFLPNPNNPIEGTLDLNSVSIIAKHCQKKNTYLVIDEVYYHYGGPNAIPLIDMFENVFIMRSFSKAFGLAGIRVGYLLGTTKNIDYVSKTRTGYETNSVSMEIASFFIDNFSIVEGYIKSVKEGLQYLKEELEDFGLEYNGGNTGNYLFVNFHDENLANTIVANMRKKGIYIRGEWPTPFSTGISITGAPKNIMKIFFEEFSSEYQKLND